MRILRDDRHTAGAQSRCALGIGPCAFQGAARLRYERAFSLLEVVAALAIFAIGMVAVFGLFAPVSKSVSGVSEGEAAARAADAVRARLQALPFDTALALIQDAAAIKANDGNGSYNPNDGTHPAVLFGKITGDVGVYDSSEGRNAWYDSSIPPAVVPNADKYFEIDLIRNATLSPADNDALAPVVAFTMRIRWPAFLPSSSGTPVQVGANQGGGGPVPFDQSKKQVLFFTGTLRR
ncbi:MAG TPA: prepilin-type N-terminal cleavage/methylation domain-containing protein [Opitutaceae bacterium]|nr:prepilin-type N-terminal cleavage/methylation domain-containing protein [Opitutaceae bacterium]